MSIRWRSVVPLVAEALGAWSLAALGAWLWHPLWTPLCMLAIATRQHALFILYHDAVHGLSSISLSGVLALALCNRAWPWLLERPLL